MKRAACIKIAILGGSTTRDIKLMLELFLLNYGIQAEFYESEFNQYYQDAMFPNPGLEAFAPDVIYVHTTLRNVTEYPKPGDPADTVDDLLAAEYRKYEKMWERLSDVYHCVIIQNNMEYPYYRLMGNKDASDIHGKVNYVTRLNLKFYEYAQKTDNFYINDINYLSAQYGLNSGRILFTGTVINMRSACRPFRNWHSVWPGSLSPSMAEIKRRLFWIWTIRSGAVLSEMTAWRTWCLVMRPRWDRFTVLFRNI